MILHIHNGRVLLDGTAQTARSLTIENGLITAVGAPVPHSAMTLDAANMLVVPGIIDLHGDAFERQLMPRPGVSIDPAVALLDTDRQLLANGITTAYHAMTWSWEPGLRSHEVGRRFVAALAASRETLGCDTRVHLRHETYNLDGEQAVKEWLSTGHIDLLAINDHTPGMAARTQKARSLATLAERAGLSEDAFSSLLDGVLARASDVPDSIARLCETARRHDIPMASHDDETAEARDGYAALGCTICEFPQNADTARHAREAGAAVVMGAPNVLRGGSHIGLVGAADLIAQDLCDVLVSDYFYPALLGAPFRLVRDGACSLPDAWRLISINAARAAGLSDRGALDPGLRADIAIVDDSVDNAPRVAATFVAGAPAFFAASFERLGGPEWRSEDKAPVAASA